MSEGKREATVLRPTLDSSVIPPAVDCPDDRIMTQCGPVPDTVTGAEETSHYYILNI